MPVSLEKKHNYYLAEPQVICTCNQIIREIDTMFCTGCGDVMCEDCYTTCMDCGMMYCKNCSESIFQCLKCYLKNIDETPDEKAYLVIGGVVTPIKNSSFMINKTSLMNAREIRLTLEGVEYKYIYRSLTQRKDDNKKYDYHLYFEKVMSVVEEEEFAKSVRDALRSYDETHGLNSEYDDYSTLGW